VGGARRLAFLALVSHDRHRAITVP